MVNKLPSYMSEWSLLLYNSDGNETTDLWPMCRKVEFERGMDWDGAIARGSLGVLTAEILPSAGDFHAGLGPEWEQARKLDEMISTQKIKLFTPGFKGMFEGRPRMGRPAVDTNMSAAVGELRRDLYTLKVYDAVYDLAGRTRYQMNAGVGDVGRRHAWINFIDDLIRKSTDIRLNVHAIKGYDVKKFEVSGAIMEGSYVAWLDMICNSVPLMWWVNDGTVVIDGWLDDQPKITFTTDPEQAHLYRSPLADSVKLLTDELITELEITNHSLKKVNGKVEALTETTRVKNQFTDAYGRRTARVDMMCPTITDAAATAGFRIFGRYTPVRAIKEVTFVPYDADAGIDDSWLAAWAVYLDIGHCIRHEGRFGDHEGVTANYHISKIKHKLTPSRWEVTYELMLLNGVNPYG